MPPAQLESLQPHISDLELSQGENPLVPDHDFRDEQNFNRPTTDGSHVVVRIRCEVTILCVTDETLSAGLLCER